jgi:aspartate/methionine/tyrosine aminotransferase
MRPGVFAELQTRIDAAVARGVDLVPLHIGDTCMPPPPLGDAWTKAPLSAYGPTSGLADLRSAFASRLARHGHGPAAIDPERHVLVGAGATHALACAARAVLSDGDEVLLLAPYWPLAHGIVTQTGARAVEVPFTDRMRAEPGLDVRRTLEAHLTPRTRAIYAITPNNPDGAVSSDATLEAIADVARRHDLWVFADEAYADWVYEGRHRSIAQLAGMAKRTISAYSASKSHALAGARIGCVVASEEVIGAARRVSVHTVFNVPVAMQRAAVAALEGDEGWTDRARDRYRAARDMVVASLAGHRFAVPEGGAYVFLDLAPELAGRPLAELLARAVDEGVVLTPGEAFGAAYRTHARLCFTSVPIERVLEGVARLRRACASLA